MHNEVKNGTDANCINEITKILEVSSRKKKVTDINPISMDLQRLANYDFEHDIQNEFKEYAEPTNANERMKTHSNSCLAAAVERKVVQYIVQSGKKACSKCINVFIENELLENDFLDFQSKASKMLIPCKSTLNIIQYVDGVLEKYESVDTSFDSIVMHMLRSLDMSRFYEASSFDEDHDHKYDLIKRIVTVYLNTKSQNMSKFITRMSQEKLSRQVSLKTVHRSGQ